jgi:hypothetical protein
MTQRPRAPKLPYEQLADHVGDNPHARQTLDALHATLEDPHAERSHVEQHVELLRAVPALTAIIENWYDSPSTQSWLKTLADIGL